MGLSHSKVVKRAKKKKKKKKEDSEQSRYENVERREQWEKDMDNSKCPLIVLEAKKFVKSGFKILTDKPNGDAVYYIYSRREKDDDPDLSEIDCDKEDIPNNKIYIPTMESPGFGQIVKLWKPEETISKNLGRKVKYLLSNKNSPTIVKVNCIVFQVGHESLGEEQEEQEEEEQEEEEEEIQKREMMIKQLSKGSLAFKWENGHKKKFSNPKYKLADKDVFFLNKNRRIEFYTWKQVKKKLDDPNSYISECMSNHFQMNDEYFGSFYVNKS